MEPRAVSQETQSWWERELSDYCFRQWLVSVWGRGKKRERVRERPEREGGREEGSEWGEGEGGCCCLKKQKSCSVLSHRKTLGLEEARGSCASHQLPICHSLTALSNRALSRSYQWRLRQWNARSLPRPACPLEHQALLTHPEGPRFSSPPLSLLFLLCSFFSPQTTFFCSLLRVLGRCWISLCHRGTWEGKQGCGSLALGDGEPEV